MLILLILELLIGVTGTILLFQSKTLEAVHSWNIFKALWLSVALMVVFTVWAFFT